MRRELFALSSFIIYSAFNNIGLSFYELIFQWNDVYIFGMILFDACSDGINVIRMYQKRHSAGSFAISVTRGRCNTVRKALLIQKLMEHHALCVIVKENIIADMFIFFFHFTDSASPQMLRFLYGAVQHLYRCNLFPERDRNIFRLQCFRNCKLFCVVQAAEHRGCSR